MRNFFAKKTKQRRIAGCLTPKSRRIDRNGTVRILGYLLRYTYLPK